MRLEYFEMLDRIVEMNKVSKSIVVESTVPLESPVFEGHFPGFPIVPGVLLSEVMGQACGVLSMECEGSDLMGVLASMNKTKYRQFVQPGDALLTFASIEHFGSGFTVCNAKIKKGKICVANSEIRISLIPFPNEVTKFAVNANRKRLLTVEL